MKTDRWQAVRDLLEDLLDLAPERRAALLDARCGDDPRLRALVEQLLAREDAGGTFLEPPDALADDAAP